MNRVTRGAVVLATIPLLLVGLASAALAGGAAQGAGRATMQAVDDANWTPAAAQGGVSTMQPFNDATWTPGGAQGGVTANGPLSSPNCPNYPSCAANNAPRIRTMRPFSDPNFPIHAHPVTIVAQPAGSRLPLVALASALTALIAAAAAWVTLGRRKRLRPA